MSKSVSFRAPVQGVLWGPGGLPYRLQMILSQHPRLVIHSSLSGSSQPCCLVLPETGRHPHSCFHISSIGPSWACSVLQLKCPACHCPQKPAISPAPSWPLGCSQSACPSSMSDWLARVYPVSRTHPFRLNVRLHYHAITVLKSYIANSPPALEGSPRASSRVERNKTTRYPPGPQGTQFCFQ